MLKDMPERIYGFADFFVELTKINTIRNMQQIL